MSRTIRRGKPTKDLNFYYKNHIFDAENRVSPYNGEAYWTWRFEGTYDEYVAEERSAYHSDKHRFGSGIPWWFRNTYERKLRQRHRQEIHHGLNTEDQDIGLTRYQHNLGWYYW